MIPSFRRDRIERNDSSKRRDHFTVVGMDFRFLMLRGIKTNLIISIETSITETSSH